MLREETRPAKSGPVKVGRCAQIAIHCLFIPALSFGLSGCLKKSEPLDSESDSAASSLVFERPSEIKCSTKTFPSGISDEEMERLAQTPAYRNAPFKECAQSADSTNLVGNNLEKALVRVSFGDKTIPIVAEKAEISLMKSSFFTAKVVAAKSERAAKRELAALKNAKKISEEFEKEFERITKGRTTGRMAEWFKFDDPLFLKLLGRTTYVSYGTRFFFDIGRISGEITPLSRVRNGTLISEMGVRILKPVEETAADKKFWEAFCSYIKVPPDSVDTSAAKRIMTQSEWSDMLQFLNSAPN